jgi:hypothetical protein
MRLILITFYKKERIMLLGLSLESIDFQDNVLGTKMAEEIRGLTSIRHRNDQEKSIHKTNLEKLIRDSIGLNIEFKLAGHYYPAAILIPHFNNQHIFLHNYYKDLINDNPSEFKELEKNLENLEKLLDSKVKNVIDIKRNKVTGVFTKIKTTLYLDLNELSACQLDSHEIVAVILHEVGHLFTYFEFSNRQNSMNQVLGLISSNQLNKNTRQQREMVFRKAEKILDLPENFLEEVVDEESDVIKLSMVVNKTAYYLKSQNNAYSYDVSSCEQLADQYSSRMGYGRHLATGLYKLHRASADPDLKEFGGGPVSRILMEIITMALGVIAVFLPGPMAAIMVGFSFLLLVINVIMAGDATFNKYNYDNVKTRLTRIRSDSIIQLNQEKDDAQKKYIINNIKTMDKLISMTFEYQDILSRLFNFLSPKHRNASVKMELLKKLELLAANDLYLKSAEFKTI